MAKQKSILGRGLNALIPGNPETPVAQQPSRIAEDNILQIPLDSIIPNPRQPRRVFSEDDPKLLELSASIKQHGLLQPLVVTRLDSGPNGWISETDTEPGAAAQNGVAQYQIIAGERRWRASRLAGLTRVPVVIKEATPQEMLELALIENIQRADLNPIEEALAYSALIEEYGMTQEAVARQVSKDRTTITNSLRLLQLAPRLREALINALENFTEGHARPLVGIREENQVIALGKIVNNKLNVRQTEELAARIKAAERADANQNARLEQKPQRSPDLDELETQFRTSLMVKVDLRRNQKGKGTLVLHFNNEDELERLYTRLVRQTD
ncbi:MAG TPA: ParB/RepB/Spo0J family partition protein [Ktedonobacteraceae bacterium]|nr:ParB/RepB/Spo0J family partition protein [Ktedonobacteraceae bacterium]